MKLVVLHPGVLLITIRGPGGANQHIGKASPSDEQLAKAEGCSTTNIMGVLVLNVAAKAMH